MPLAERVIQPTNLGAKPLDLLDQEKGTTHLAVATNSLIGALLQLASLVRHADDIFCDLTDECQKVFDRADKVAKKLCNVEVCVKQLDAKNVLIRKCLYLFIGIITSTFFLSFLFLFQNEIINFNIYISNSLLIVVTNNALKKKPREFMYTFASSLQIRVISIDETPTQMINFKTYM